MPIPDISEPVAITRIRDAGGPGALYIVTKPFDMTVDGETLRATRDDVLPLRNNDAAALVAAGRVVPIDPEHPAAAAVLEGL